MTCYNGFIKIKERVNMFIGGTILEAKEQVKESFSNGHCGSFFYFSKGRKMDVTVTHFSRRKS